MSSLKNVQEIVENGYSLSFGKVFEDAFENFKKIFGVAGLAILLYSLILGALAFTVIIALSSVTGISDSLAGFNINALSGVDKLLFILFSITISVFSYFMTAGFLKMAYLADVNKSFGIGTTFDSFRGDNTKELFVAALVISICSISISTFIENLSNDLLGNIASATVSYLTVFTIPLIIFSRLTAFQAIKYSIKLVFKQPFIILFLLIFALVLACLGIIALCLGIFFTLPLLYSMNFAIYNNVLPIQEQDEIDNIGKIME